mgnify:CR=1 FL=1
MSKNKTFNIVCWIFVVAFLLITVFPFFWILISSFKPESEIFGANCYRIIAENPTMENYKVVIFEKGMLRAIGKLTDVLHGVCYGELFFRLRHLVYLQQQL